MEKTKNLFLSTIIAVAMMITTVFCFTACGEQPVKADDVIGDWNTLSATYTEEGHDTVTYTYQRFVELRDKADKTPEETNEYNAMLHYYIFKYKVVQGEEQNTIKLATYSAPDNYQDIGTWVIENAKLVVTINPASFPNVNTVTTEYKNGNLIVTATGDDFVTVFTLGKIVA